jgi:hypothetical protein
MSLEIPARAHYKVVINCLLDHQALHGICKQGIGLDYAGKYLSKDISQARFDEDN